MDSQGTPLSFLLDVLNENNSVVDWIDFIEYSVEKNWKIQGTLLKIQDSTSEVYGTEYSDQIIMRIKYYLLQKLSVL